MVPQHQIRARFDAQSIVVYQAFNHAIAGAAVEAQRLVPPFSYGRMTWVKPSFLWMMERCGWASKPNQERVLAIHLARVRFDEAVAAAVSTRVEHSHAAIRVQWDPERDLRGNKLTHRSLQLGLGRPVCRAYATEWIVRVEDVTALVKRLDALRKRGDHSAAAKLLPVERPYQSAGSVSVELSK
ncbi:MAG: DUF4291 domain-containing protein [Myxococcaceae bacterium]